MNQAELEVIGEALGELRADLTRRIAAAIEQGDASAARHAAQAAQATLADVELQVRSRAEAAYMQAEAMRAQVAELAEQVRLVLSRAEERLLTLRDGRDGERGQQGAAGSSGEPGPRGETGIAGRDGRDGRDGIDGRDGEFPPTQEWRADQAYPQLAVVTHRGGCWQARASTQGVPGTAAAWLPLVIGLAKIQSEARSLVAEGKRYQAVEIELSTGDRITIRVRDRSPNPTGKYLEERRYQCGDLATWNGCAWIAAHDDVHGVEPGTGDGWILLAQRGERGKRGERGETGAPGREGRQGERGEAGERGSAGPAGVLGLWRGRYDSARHYSSGEVVNHNHALWLALHDGPGVPGARPGEWDVLLTAPTAR